MSQGKLETNAEELARDPGPVRRWLTNYFRRRVVNAADVEDMVQEVFVRLVSRNSTETVEHLGGYLVKTAASVIADSARRRSSRMGAFHVPLDEDHHGDEDIHPERVLLGKEELHAAIAALLSLPERTRAVFILRRLENCRHADIARRLGISVSAVEKHMVRAIQHVNQEMEKRRGS
jgi:RNA polymerase sigma factor (sigma-70 family)